MCTMVSAYFLHTKGGNMYDTGNGKDREDK